MVSEAKLRLNESRLEMAAALTPVRSAFRGEPKRRDVETVLQNRRHELNQFEANQANTRPPIMQQGHPPARIRQYIKGLFIFQITGRGWGGRNLHRYVLHSKRELKVEDFRFLSSEQISILHHPGFVWLSSSFANPSHAGFSLYLISSLISFSVLPVN